MGACKRDMIKTRLYYNGKVLTVDRDLSIRQAFAIRGGRFEAVGSDDDILALASPGTEKVDLRGRTVIPGLGDSHCHAIGASLRELGGEIPAPRTTGEALEWVKGRASCKPPGEWIVIPKIFATRLRERRLPSRAELDNAAPAHPVFLDATYSGTVNSAALQLSGIDRNTREPGIIKDERTGEPTGELRASAFSLLKRPPGPWYSPGERRDALRDMLHRYNARDITSITDNVASFEETDIYRELIDRDELTARISVNCHDPSVSGSRQDTQRYLCRNRSCSEKGAELLRAGALKVFLDGGILTGTAYMREPWGEGAAGVFSIRDPGYRGVVNYTLPELTRTAQAAFDSGWSFTAHVTGDAGVDLLLDTYEALHRRCSIRDRRFSIIHGNFFHPGALERCREMGVFLEVQPAWFFKDADAMVEILGKERTRHFHPYRSVLEAGVTMCGGSDHMVKFDARSAINPYDPLLGIYTMATHRTEDGTPVYPGEAIGRMEALKTYTFNVALRTGEEGIKGSIEPGKLADFAILDSDFLGCEPEELLEIDVAATVLGGRTVFVGTREG